MIKPYYETELGTLYQGDCLEILPQLTEKVDLVLTDPPYGIGFKGEKWDNSIPSWLDVARTVSKTVIFTTAPLTLWQYPQPSWVMCWYRPASNSRSLLKGGFNHWSPVLVYGDVKFPVDCINLHAIANMTDKDVGHPSPKPLKLFFWIIKYGSEGGLILDPFLGSGTTAVACERLDRRWIGIEISKEYCDIAVKRIEAERAQLKLGLGD